MYVVCSAHICQGLRGWAGVEGGGGGYWKQKEDGGEKQGERVCVCLSVCGCVCVLVCVLVCVSSGPLLRQRSLIPHIYCGRISLIAWCC